MKIDDQGSPNFSDVNLKDKQYDVFDIQNSNKTSISAAGSPANNS